MGPAKCPFGFQGREKRQIEGKGEKGEKKGVIRREGGVK